METSHVAKSIIVGYDSTNGKDSAVLIVGEKKKGQTIDILNAFQGKEAEELWLKLTTKKGATQ
jgi:hypothetical protein